MQNTLNITRNTLQYYFSERGNLIGLIVLPVIFTIVLGAAFGGTGGGPSQVRVDVIDLDNSIASAQFIDLLRQDALLLCPMDDEEENCRLEDNPIDPENPIQRIDADVVNSVIVIPAGYSEALETFAEIDIAYFSTESLLTPGLAGQSLQAVLQRVNGGIVAARVGTGLVDGLGGDEPILTDEARDTFQQTVYDRAREMWDGDPVDVRFVLTQEGDQTDATTQGFGQSVPGMGSMYVMFTVFGGMILLIRERKQWTLQRLVVMPVSRSQILAGYILSYFTLGMIQYIVVFAVGVFVGLDFGNSPVALVLVMIAFTLCVTALTFALATQIKSEAQANSMTTLLALILAPLGGAWWPLEIVPEFMRTIGHISPVAWAMDGYRELIFFGGGLTDVLIPIAVLVVAAGVLFVIGVRGFQYE